MATLANHTLRPEVQAILRYREDPALFVREVIKAEPAPWQLDVLNSINKHPRISIRAGNGTGKTCLIAWTSLWAIMTYYDIRGAIVASSREQISSTTWPEIGKWLQQIDPVFKREINFTDEALELRSGKDLNFIAKRAVDVRTFETTQGLHAPNVLWIGDEASGIPDQTFSRANGIFTSDNPHMILCSNPTRNMGYWYKTQTEFTNWKTFHISAIECPNVNQDFVNGIRDEFGTDSYEWSVQVLGEFYEIDENQLISRQNVQGAMNRENITPPKGAPIIWGVDVGLMNDKSALSKRQANVKLGTTIVWNAKETTHVTGRIVDEFNETPPDLKPDYICVDSIGIGSGVKSELKEANLPNVKIKSVNVSESASRKERFINLRSELWWKTREWFGGLDCHIPPEDKQLLSELISPTYNRTAKGKIQLEPKDETKKRLGKSPDYADSFVMTFYPNTSYDYTTPNGKKKSRGLPEPKAPWVM